MTQQDIKLMITEESIRKFISDLGYIPASPKTCAYFINDSHKRGHKEINFYINKQNMCWVTTLNYISPGEYAGNGEIQSANDKLITVTMEQLIRDIKLAQLDF